MMSGFSCTTSQTSEVQEGYKEQAKKLQQHLKFEKSKLILKLQVSLKHVSLEILPEDQVN